LGQEALFMRLFIARHGATQHNLDGRLTGQIDAPLSALGVRQAEALADRLDAWRFDTIISSDLARARATADAIARRHGAPIQLDTDLREIDMGAWSGKPYAEWSEQDRQRFKAMECDPTGRITAPGGESFAMLAERVERALQRTRERHPDGTVLWVAHGGVIGSLLLSALGLGSHQRRQFQRANCALFELRYEGERVFIARLNDTSHLEALEASEVGEERQAL
jgi:ribonuclease H / adenosylcobalamin/alpha-ribazole phosphatase